MVAKECKREIRVAPISSALEMSGIRRGCDTGRKRRHRARKDKGSGPVHRLGRSSCPCPCACLCPMSSLFASLPVLPFFRVRYLIECRQLPSGEGGANEPSQSLSG